MKLRQLLTLLFCLVPLAAWAGDSDYSGDAAKGGKSDGHTIYKSVTPDGRVVFSDTPPPGSKAKKIEVGPTNVQPIALPRPLPVRKLSPKDDGRRRDSYQGPYSIEIVSPTDGATIPPGQRSIALQVAVAPVPQDGYQFFAVVDGQPWQGGSSGTSLDISALERGTHTVQAVLTDLSGAVLAQSQNITVYVKRPGGTLPDNPAPQAVPAPKAPVAPGLKQSQPSQQPRKRRPGYN